MSQEIQSNMHATSALETKSETKEHTFFGITAYYYALDLLNRIMSTAAMNWKPENDYVQIPLPEYFTTVTLTLPNSEVKKYHYHKLMYGPVLTINGKENFFYRTDNEQFWGNQWEFEYSPFRIVQKILKDNGLYLVDHTFKGKKPFVYLYRFLPHRNVIVNNPWHDYCNIPNLTDKDFVPKRLNDNDVLSALAKSSASFNEIVGKANLNGTNVQIDQKVYYF